MHSSLLRVYTPKLMERVPAWDELLDDETEIDAIALTRVAVTFCPATTGQIAINPLPMVEPEPEENPIA